MTDIATHNRPPLPFAEGHNPPSATPASPESASFPWERQLSLGAPAFTGSASFHRERQLSPGAPAFTGSASFHRERQLSPGAPAFTGSASFHRERQLSPGAPAFTGSAGFPAGTGNAGFPAGPPGTPASQPASPNAGSPPASVNHTSETTRHIPPPNSARRLGRLPQVLFIKSIYLPPCQLLTKKNIQDWDEERIPTSPPFPKVSCDLIHTAPFGRHPC